MNSIKITIFKLSYSIFLPLWNSRWIVLPIMTSIFIMAMIIGSVLAAPREVIEGDVQRLMYIHVPSAIIGQSVYLMMAFFGSVCLIWRTKLAGMFLRSAAPLGASFTLIALVSGAVWGKPTWGTWWVWDARLTSTLILFFLYAGIIGLYSSINNKPKGDRAASLISVVGVVILSLIHI